MIRLSIYHIGRLMFLTSFKGISGALLFSVTILVVGTIQAKPTPNSESHFVTLGYQHINFDLNTSTSTSNNFDAYIL